MDRQESPKSSAFTAFDVCDELWRLLKSYKAHVVRIADKHGLTMMQFGALYAVSQGNSTMGKVAQTMHCDASNITGVADRLVSLGLIVRHDDPRDRRIKGLLLTPHGNSTLQEILQAMPAALGCDQLTSQELQQLLSLLRKLDANSQTAAP